MTVRPRETPETNLVWRLNGRGFDSLGLFSLPRPTITDDQLLVRQEVATICFSSVKVIMAGETHPRLQGRDLSTAPVVLGDEAFVVVEEVGRNLRHRFKVGEGYAIMPDLGTNAFGYDIDGGLQRYNVLEGRILDALLPVEQATIARAGMFAVSLSEPLGCVEKSYHLEYRTGLKERGALLIARTGVSTVDQEIVFQQTLTVEIAAKRPSRIVGASLTDDLTEAIRRQAERAGIDLISLDRLESISTAVRPYTAAGFDDIILLGGGQAETIGRVARETIDLLAPAGILNLVGNIPSGTPLPIDIGRTHYDRTLVVGTAEPDFLHAYRANTDHELREGSVAVFIGAGGPMGQLHLLRAMGMDAPPAKIIAVEVEPARLAKLERWRQKQYAPAGTELMVMNPNTQHIADVLAGDAINCLVLLSPVAQIIEEYTPYFAPKAVVNAFAGLKGQQITLDAAVLCQKHLRVVGHSGVDVATQRLALEKIAQGKISVDPVVSAVGGIQAARDALWATAQSTYPGKIVLYLSIDLPLTPIETITGEDVWSAEHERALLRKSGGW
ncbi:MAG: hypothetical protein HY710_13110 [Candidatus Latescibacteria bacterium]|nr:hypothetical protein [Candidatus Latescibacterota bacterium]